MSGLLVKLAIVAALFTVVWVMWRRATFRGAQRVELVQVRGRCATVKEHATILVLIVTHGNAHAAARAVHSVFNSATCPFRVFVALHETADAPYTDPAAMRNVVAQATPTMALYADLARAGRYGRSFAEQVRALRAPLAKSFGIHAARAALMAQGYRGHTFVMTLSDDAELLPGWDEAAIDLLAACGDPHALLVAPPALSSSENGGGGGGRGRDRDRDRDRWDAAADALLAPTGGAADAAMPRFPVFDRFSKAGLPVITSRAFGRPKASLSADHGGRPVPALYWVGDCSFGPARAYVTQYTDGIDPDVPPLPTPFDASLACLTSGEDGLMSARMWTSGWAFYAPCTALAAYQSQSNATPDADKAAIVADGAKSATAKLTHEAARLLLGGGLKEGDAPRILYVQGLGPLKTLEEWQAFAGLNVAKRVAGGRARMGSTPTPDATEVVTKYDSWASYYAERGAYA